LIGRRVQESHLLWERTLAEPSPGEFQERILGQTVKDVGRRGKYLLFNLTPDTLLIHLRMSGDLLVEDQNAPLAPHHRLLLDLEGDIRLAFNDARKFGRWSLIHRWLWGGSVQNPWIPISPLVNFTVDC
jgi:formamidopyrimidine-DNA glycosylase